MVALVEFDRSSLVGHLLGLIPGAANEYPTETSKRFLRRRPIYLDAGFNVEVRSGQQITAGKVIDMTPKGLGLVVFDPISCPQVDEVVSVKHTGLVTTGICHIGTALHVTTMNLRGKSAFRIGMALEEMRGNSSATAFAASPLFFEGMALNSCCTNLSERPGACRIAEQQRVITRSRTVS